MVANEDSGNDKLEEESKVILFYVHDQVVGKWPNQKVSLKETYQKLLSIFGGVVVKINDYALDESLLSMAFAIEDGYLFSDSAREGTYEAHFNDDGSVTYDIAYGYPVGYGLNSGPWNCSLEKFHENFFVKDRV